MKNPYYLLVSRFAKLLEEGIDIPVGGTAPTQSIPIPSNAPKILLFSPHPDDESITGALPLRLLRELGMNVINVAVTLGRRSERKVQRWEELQNACKYLGFGLTKTTEKGLEEINLDTRKQKPDRWSGAVDIILEILSENQPVAIFVPHAKDCHSNHIGTHYLIVDALKKMPPDFGCFVVETEFWQTMETPNLLIESNTKDVSDLVTALSFHVGEVIRNPYHLRLPAWMADNVRRGGELVGGWGEAVPVFMFATLYRLRKWRGLQLQGVFEEGKIFSCDDDLRVLFNPST